MNKKIVLLTLVSVFSLSAMVVTSSAQPRIVGVNVGDWFKYGDIAVTWSSNDPNATFPPPGYEGWEELNETEWVSYSVEDISSTNITFQSTEHFKNGTERTESGYIDIDAGGGNMTYMAISANLDVNDTVYTSVDYTWRINETVVRTYPDGVRDTNHVNMTGEYSWTINETECYYYYFMNFYWDKPTGIIVESSIEERNQTGDYLTTWSVSMGITDSNKWVVPEFPTWTSILILCVVITFATAICKRRLLKTPIH